jgi:hypothetical protein
MCRVNKMTHAPFPSAGNRNATKPGAAQSLAHAVAPAVWHTARKSHPRNLRTPEGVSVVAGAEAEESKRTSERTRGEGWAGWHAPGRNEREKPQERTQRPEDARADEHPRPTPRAARARLRCRATSS